MSAPVEMPHHMMKDGADDKEDEDAWRFLGDRPGFAFLGIF